MERQRMTTLLRGDSVDGRFLRAAAQLVRGSAIAQAVVLLALPWITRLYSPEQFGRLGVFLSFVSLAAVPVMGKYELALAAASNNREATRILRLSLRLLPAGALLATGGLLLLTFIPELGLGRLPRWWSWFFLPLVGAFAFASLSRCWCVRYRDYAAVAQAAVIQNSVRVGTLLVCGLSGLTSVGLLAGEVLGRGGAALRMGVPVLTSALAQGRRRKGMMLKRTARRYADFPLYCLPSAWLDALVLAAPLPLLVHFFGDSVGGAYDLVARLYSLPLLLLGPALSDSFWGQLAGLAGHSPSAARDFLDRTAWRLFWLGLVPMLVLALVGPTLIGVVFGSQWRLSGRFAPLLAPLALAQFVVSPLSQSVAVYRAYRLKLLTDVGRLVAMFAAIGGCAWFRAGPAAAVGALAVAGTVAYVSYFVVLRLIAARAASIGRGARLPLERPAEWRRAS